MSDSELREIANTMTFTAGFLYACALDAVAEARKDNYRRVARSMLWGSAKIHLALGDGCFLMPDGFMEKQS